MAILTALKTEWYWQSLILRRALRSAIVVFISILLYRKLNLAQGYWITLTGMLVVQATLGATLRKSIQRFIGTLLGVGIASLLLLKIHNIYAIDSIVIILLFITYFFNPFSNLVNYGFVVIPVSITVVLMIALISPEKMTTQLMYARFYDTAIGALLGIMGALLLFPNRVKNEFSSHQQYLCAQLADYIVAIINMLLNQSGAAAKANLQRQRIEEALLTSEQLAREYRYEINFHAKNPKIFMKASQHLAQQFFSLHHVARYPLASELLSLNRPVLENLRDHYYALLQHQSTYYVALETALMTLQQQLAKFAQHPDNPTANWQYLAPLANVNFILQAALKEMIILIKLST